MQRIPIRNEDSPNAVKPRLFDALVDSGSVRLEFKIGKNREIVSLESVMRQISKAEKAQ